jgi:hypothetical protein
VHHNSVSSGSQAVASQSPLRFVSVASQCHSTAARVTLGRSLNPRGVIDCNRDTTLSIATYTDEDQHITFLENRNLELL